MKSYKGDRERGVSKPGPVRSGPASSPPLLLLVEESQTLSRCVGFLCDYLGVQTQRLGMREDASLTLHARRPIGALLFVGDQPIEDGLPFLKQWAKHDRDLPIMIIIGSIAGSNATAAAVAETGIRVVRIVTTTPGIGDFAEFVADAARRQGERR